MRYSTILAALVAASALLAAFAGPLSPEAKAWGGTADQFRGPITTALQAVHNAMHDEGSEPVGGDGAYIGEETPDDQPDPGDVYLGPDGEVILVCDENPCAGWPVMGGDDGFDMPVILIPPGVWRPFADYVTAGVDVGTAIEWSADNWEAAANAWPEGPCAYWEQFGQLLAG